MYSIYLSLSLHTTNLCQLLLRETVLVSLLCHISHTTVHLIFTNFIILPYSHNNKLLITQFPPAPYHFLYLRSGSPHHQ